ncbi:MAG: DUF92 domain-containing protein, partial [Myxococcota bacterium]
MSTVSFIALFVVLVLATLVAAELLLRRLNVPFELARKSFHLLAGTVALLMTVNAPSRLPLVITGALFAVTLPASIVLGLFKIQTRERGFGTVAFALGYSVVAWLYFEQPVVMVSALVVLTYGDGLAAIIGTTIGRNPFGLGNTHKTIEGTASFAFVSWIGVATTLVLYNAASPFRALAIGFLLAVLCAVVEALCSSDIDNGVLPIYAAVVLDAMLMPRGFPAVMVGFALALLIVGLALWRHWITLQGGVVAGLITVTMFGIGEFAWLAPVFLLLASSSLVSSFVGKVYRNPFSAREGPRGIEQILAKGGPSLVCVLLFGATRDPVWFFVMLTLVATAAADTFASSIGGLDPVDPVPALPWFNPVPKGTSGGVSAYGTLAACFASTAVASLALVQNGG